MVKRREYIRRRLQGVRIAVGCVNDGGGDNNDINDNHDNNHDDNYDNDIGDINDNNDYDDDDDDINDARSKVNGDELDDGEDE